MISASSITTKINDGERLTEAEALFLYESLDLFALGKLAAQANERVNGRKVYYNVNRHINYTNICVNRCRFCAFRRDSNGTGAYLLSNNEMRAMAAEAFCHGAREIHMVGGLHPDLPLDYYLEMLQTVKSVSPSLHLKAFTAVEIDHFARMSGLPVRNILLALKEAGLDSLPGGGAEIFSEIVRSALCADKISGDRWLEIMEEAHRCGLHSNATMLYGHVENFQERIGHMARLRKLQDLTGGFQAFIPLPFQPTNTELKNHIAGNAGGIDDLRTIAVARLFLDNFRHIKAYWVLLGEKIAQVALAFGANDLDGTVVDERIGHEAGADSPRGLGKEQIVHLIRRAGKEPVERDSLYQEVEE